MRFALCVAAAATLLSACATDNTALSPNAALTATGQVAGVVKLPDGTSAPCEQLTVLVHAGDELVGRVSARPSRARCSYEVKNLPTGAELQVQVDTAGVQCSNGGALSVQGDAKPVTLQDRGLATRDFVASCQS